MGVNNILYGDRRFEIIRYQLFDFSKIDDLIATDMDARVVGTLDKSASIWNNDMKGAILASNPKIIELINIYIDQLDGTNWQVKIFSNLESANEWINS